MGRYCIRVYGYINFRNVNIKHPTKYGYYRPIHGVTACTHSKQRKNDRKYTCARFNKIFSQKKRVHLIAHIIDNFYHNIDGPLGERILSNIKALLCFIGINIIITISYLIHFDISLIVVFL